MMTISTISETCYISGQGFPILFLSLVLFLASSLEIADGAGRRERVTAKKGVVATEETVCSEIGRNILVKGGHAVDAAVAAALCLGVVGPANSGLGGGGFMLVRSANGDAKVFDAREMAPGRASKDMFGTMHPSLWRDSPLSIGVPGQLAGLNAAHKKYGKLPWSSLVKPVENLARNCSKGDPADSRLKNLADTLATISKHPIDRFYKGAIAKNLAKEIQEAGGILTADDFKKYKVIPRKPLVAHVLGYKIVTAPPPTSGGAMLILILKILSNYKANGAPASLNLHRAVEALKYALAMRMDLGDPSFANVTTVLKKMISTSFALKLKNQINDTRTFNSEYYGGKWRQVNDHGTTHMVVVDSKRNVVTMTMSINTYYGSKLLSPSTGIYMNNQMCDFSIPTTSSGSPPPSPANSIRPYKRPLSSMTPAIFIQDGKVRVVVGGDGGILIPDAVTEVLLNYLKLRMDPFDAVRAPRMYHTLYPNVLYLESYTSKKGDRYEYLSSIIKELKAKGHTLEMVPRRTGCQFVIQGLNGELVAVTDPRKNGFPAGY